MSDATAIPRYQLYGEVGTARPFEFVHVEPLHVRSERYDWTIDVHAHAGLAQLVVLLDGAAEVAVDDRTWTVRPPAAVTIPAGSVHALDIDPGSSGYVVMVADDELGGAELGRWLRAELLDRPVMLRLPEQTATDCGRLCEALRREQGALEAAHEAMSLWLTLALLTVLARRTGGGEDERGRGVDRFRDFRRLVEEHFASHRPISWYAEQLHTSESSLDRVCRRVTGGSAFETVQARIEVEARRRLRYTSVPVGVLAAELGFDDQSYFARFFRRRTGASPSEFRDRGALRAASPGGPSRAPR